MFWVESAIECCVNHGQWVGVEPFSVRVMAVGDANVDIDENQVKGRLQGK